MKKPQIKVTDYSDSIVYIKQEIERAINLLELSHSGNIFAKSQLNSDITGNRFNLLALMNKCCIHNYVLPSGKLLKSSAIVEAFFSKGFLLTEEICFQCGKTLGYTIKRI